MGSIKVAVDAGHGYNTAGKRSPAFVRTVTHTYDGKTITVKEGSQFREHVANAGVADYLANYLSRLGFDVLRTGFDDDDGTNDTTDMSINKRQSLIRGYGCQYSLSCHFNANTGKWNSANGIEALYDASEKRAGDSKALARAIQSRIQPVYGQKNRGAKTAKGLGMCNATGMECVASVLMEYAFMDNQFEAERYFCNPESWYRYAIATADGFVDYLTGGALGKEISRTDATKKEALWVQIMLNKALNSGLVLDGIWGTKTKKAVIQFYTKNGLGASKGEELSLNAVKMLSR
ncbi:MAG: hypothetical protein E7256_08220 [Lachnospiraceae bacterium]|nr:hypothetical protein [Lachnospiraceae bacterium]